MDWERGFFAVPEEDDGEVVPERSDGGEEGREDWSVKRCLLDAIFSSGESAGADDRAALNLDMSH